MNNTKIKIAVESLSLDLHRIALGYHRGSIAMAKRFIKEALKRRSEIPSSKVKPYFAKILKALPEKLEGSDTKRIAEDALLYSVLCKNYAKKFL